MCQCHRLLMLCFLVADLVGCEVSYTTVTGNRDYPSDYKKDAIYVLQQDVFVIPTAGPIGVEYFAVGPGKAANLGPDSVADYEANKTSWSKTYGVRLLRAGAKFRLVDLVLEKNPEAGHLLWAVGELVNTDTSIKGRVELDSISHYSFFGPTPYVYVDSDYLRLETAPAGDSTTLPMHN